MAERFIEPTQEAGAALYARNLIGEILMLNLLRFREIADYSANPELAPENEISGSAAYQKYIEHTLPLLRESGGEIVLLGKGGKFFIGPQDEQWDLVMIIRQKSLSDFISFAGNEEYMAGIGHRTAALLDSRLLPISEIVDGNITLAA
ncbi:MAG: DUF1330 domain-containing protein [Anaerolineae bacterium]|nr:DUF1330 domain-containing protein [Anaerolineae bacterium]